TDRDRRNGIRAAFQEARHQRPEPRQFQRHLQNRREPDQRQPRVPVLKGDQMTRIRVFTLVLISALLAAPMFAARGSANFTVFVAIGDSYGAGLESGSLNLNHQPHSWPAVIARQAGVTDFQQPLVSFPGIGNELQLVDIIHFPPTILPATAAGQPINLSLPRPYNNLSVPGANVADVITLTGKEPPRSAQDTAR